MVLVSYAAADASVPVGAENVKGLKEALGAK